MIVIKKLTTWMENSIIFKAALLDLEYWGGHQSLHAIDLIILSYTRLHLSSLTTPGLLSQIQGPAPPRPQSLQWGSWSWPCRYRWRSWRSSLLFCWCVHCWSSCVGSRHCSHSAGYTGFCTGNCQRSFWWKYGMISRNSSFS